MSEPAGNPYVGPRPFEEQHRRFFFGRDDEIQRLVSLAVARRAVLLYSPSGAGKSSLLRAGLLPELRDTFGAPCLPVARVGGEPDAAGAANGYVFQLLTDLFEERAGPEDLAGLSLTEGIGRELERLAAEAPDGTPPEVVFLTLDQFEEIFSAGPHRQREQEDFFRQLWQALRDHSELTLLLALREDWLAYLDPYLHLLPDRLRSRYRLELLSPEQALEAVIQPAGKENVRFHPEAARLLVDDLLKSQAQAPDGSSIGHQGTHVHPVQLQVVCCRLWEKRAGAAEIDEAQVRAKGDVNHILAEYFGDRAEKAARAAGLPPRVVREWCETELILPQGFRNRVPYEGAVTRGLPEAALQDLVDSYLVRTERWSGARYYELAHDRLVRAVRESNEEWRRTHQSPLEKEARRWKAGDSKVRLLKGRNLKRVLKSLPGDAPPVVQEFLAASLKRKGNKMLGLTVLIILVALITVTGLLLFSRVSVARWAGYGTLSRVQADMADLSSRRIDRALLLAREAGPFEDWLPRPLREEGWRPERKELPDPRLLLFQSLTASPSLDMLLHAPQSSDLTTVAWRPADGWLATGDGRDGTMLLWRPEQPSAPAARLRGSGAGLAALGFSAEGGRLVAVRTDGTLEMADPATGHRSLRSLGEPALCAALSPNASTAATCGRDNRIRLWNTATGRLVRQLPAGPALVASVAFSPDGHTLAAGHRDGTFLLLDAATGAPRGGLLDGGAGPVQALAFAPRGDRLALGGAGGAVELWDLRALRPLAEPFHGLEESVRSLAFHPDGDTLASAHGRAAALWRPHTGPALGKVVPAFPSLAAGARSESLPPWLELPGGTLMARSPQDPGLVATASPAGIFLWDLTVERLAAGPFRGHRGTVRALAFDRSGRQLFSAGDDGRVIRWNVDFEAWDQRADRIANRKITCEDFRGYFPQNRRTRWLLFPSLSYPPSLLCET